MSASPLPGPGLSSSSGSVPAAATQAPWAARRHLSNGLPGSGSRSRPGSPSRRPRSMPISRRSRTWALDAGRPRRLPEEAARVVLVTAVADAPLPAAVVGRARDGAGPAGGRGERQSPSVRRRSAKTVRTPRTRGCMQQNSAWRPTASRRPCSAVGRPSGARLPWRIGSDAVTALDDAAMGVVVQAIVPADAAVVVFTRHPVTRRTDQLLINAVRGLGEPMVSGLATPDEIVVDKVTGDVVTFTPGDEGERLMATDTGLTHTVDPATGPVLADSVVDLPGPALHPCGGGVRSAGRHRSRLRARSLVPPPGPADHSLRSECSIRSPTHHSQLPRAPISP